MKLEITFLLFLVSITVNIKYKKVRINRMNIKQVVRVKEVNVNKNVMMDISYVMQKIK